ncbi:phosphatidylserine decarboxylase [Argonema antarcticum]|uniref:phosphatidylserine decarboxylase n=1 Tax=Argonema antarcticum TaxID=2942763 RepID=UPI0020110A65|nr:phosphatidylserine decarboxylase [Argonema antarcticum]MCL1475864.1 phosphatidylserine decarboxylase [Argonema antarcticum A004/B2]
MIATTNSKTEVSYRDRQTGKIIPETIFMEDTLRWLYENPLGFEIFERLLNNYSFSDMVGKWQDRPCNQKRIKKFIYKYHINIEEAELPLGKYDNFNDFFSRRLKLDARPFVASKNVLTSAGDGKIIVYPFLEKESLIPVKRGLISPEYLLSDNATAKIYFGGSALVLRLAPYDYHRFHFVDDGLAGNVRNIKGQYHSVNPIALDKVPQLYYFNKRTVTELTSSKLGKITYVEVGAFCVGSIIQTFIPGYVTRGQEKGYFRLGGSTSVLLFEPGAIRFDNDLVADSEQGLEVQVKTGTRIGIK